MTITKEDLQEKLQNSLWLLEADRPELELKARFLLEITERGLRPSPVQFARWWRKKRRELPPITLAQINLILKATYISPLRRLLNGPSSLWTHLMSERWNLAGDYYYTTCPASLRG